MAWSSLLIVCRQHASHLSLYARRRLHLVRAARPFDHPLFQRAKSSSRWRSRPRANMRGSHLQRPRTTSPTHRMSWWCRVGRPTSPPPRSPCRISTTYQRQQTSKTIDCRWRSSGHSDESAAHRWLTALTPCLCAIQRLIKTATNYPHSSASAARTSSSAGTDGHVNEFTFIRRSRIE